MDRHSPSYVSANRWTSFAGWILAAIIVLGPVAAQAQYRNTSFAFDLGGWFISRPPIIDTKTDTVMVGADLPLRTFGGFRIGGESAFKLGNDHFWFVPKLNLGVLFFHTSGSSSRTAQFDQKAKDTIGTLLGLQGVVSVRYYILTDRIRPYIQLGASYQRLFSFESKANETCTDTVLCPAGGANQDTFLAHVNMGGIHIEPGIEFILHRDMALRVFGDVQRWIILNAADNYSGVVGIGAVFYI